MLRAGLTGDLGSGKSTVARLFAERGAVVFSSDEMAREMMQPGEAVYAAIVAAFGEAVVAQDGTLDRKELAWLAFDPANPRVEEMNALVHPAVLAEQARQIDALAKSNPHAIAVVESALIFSTKHAGDRPWKNRFDVIVLVVAPDEAKIERFVRRMSGGTVLSAEERTALEADARKRLALQRDTAHHAGECLVVPNISGLVELEEYVDVAWQELLQRERALPSAR